MIEHTKENIIKLLEKISELDMLLIKSSSNDYLRQLHICDLNRLSDIIRIMKDQAVFEAYWALLIDNIAEKALFEEDKDQ